MKFYKIIALGLLSMFTSLSLNAHCQVPCGIYGDSAKFAELEQHVETIAKAGAQIRSISAQESLSAQDKQQLIRWTMNKESHAQAIIDEAANYFLAQRIKAGAGHYEDKLEVLHQIIVIAMKSKQSVESEPAEKLAAQIAAFKELYLHHTH